jgi:hypothetical protein
MSDFTKFSDGTNEYNVKDANALPKSGGAVTGQITTNQTEFTVSNQLISKGYVDSAIAAITDYETEVFPNA